MKLKHAALALLVSLNIIAAPVQAMTDDLILYPQQIVNVYDGDTFYVDLPNIHPVFGKELKVRVLDIDAPEIRSTCSTSVQKAYEKALAVQVKDEVIKMLASAKVIRLTGVKRDMYFRIDATVWADDINVGQTLIDKGLAYPYDGGTKVGWCNIQ